MKNFIIENVGVLGGMGPAASAEFLKIFVQLCLAKKYQEHSVNDFVQDLPVLLVHIIGETVLLAQQWSPDGAWMRSAKGTRKTGPYNIKEELC